MTKITANQTPKYFALIGRNLLLYQYIELHLKVTLPFLFKKAEISLDDPFDEVRQRLQSKGTMGPLMEEFKQAIDSSHPEGVSEYLEKLVADRNELIHGFLRLPFTNLGEVNEAAVEEYLHTKHSFALPIFELLEDILDEIKK